MCDVQSNAFERPVTGRRTVLKALGTTGGALVFASAASAVARAAAPDRPRCYVIVLDGCRPEEIGGGLMPTVKSLRDAGANYPRATSLPVMETIPNHVMMMTGVRPDRSGVPSNSIYDRSLGEERTLDRPEDLRATTVIRRLRDAGKKTATVLSKSYLFGIFSGQAEYWWEPAPLVPVSEHAPDTFTVDAAIALLDEADPDFMFVNLGDIDRMGHSDLTGTTVVAARAAALADTDLQVTRLVNAIKGVPGRWESSMLVFLADHSMDWSLPHKLVSLAPVFEASPLLAGRVAIADNGGADLCYWTGPDADRAAAIEEMLRLSRAHEGVLEAHDVAATPELRLGPEAGDVLVSCRSGWRFSDPSATSNPVPGNHGHPATYPIPFFLAGGHPIVPRGTASSVQAFTIDVAPTVAAFFGISAPAEGWDGTSRL